MAIFNPEPQKTNDPNYLRASKGSVHAEASRTSSILAEGAGNLVGMAAQGIDYTLEEAAKEEVRTKAEQERDQYGPFSVMRIAQQEGGPLDLVSDKPMDIRSPIGRFSEKLNHLVQARNAGKLTDTYYGGRLDAIVREVKSKYPGYEKAIDQEIQRVTGITPANFVREAIQRDLDTLARQTKGDSEDRLKLVLQYGKYLPNEPDGSPNKLVLSLLNGNITPEAFSVAVTTISSAMEGVEREKKLLDLKNSRNQSTSQEQEETLTSSLNTLVRTGITTDTHAQGGVPNILQKIQKAQKEGAFLDPDQNLQLRNELAFERTKYLNQLRAEVAHPRYNKVGKQYKENSIKEAMGIFDDLADAITNEKFGIATAQANWIQHVQDSTLAEMLKVSQDLQVGTAIKKAGGENAFNVWLLNSGGLEGIMKAYHDAVLQNVVGGGVTNLGETLEQMAKKNRLSPTLATQIIDNTKGFLTDKNSPIELKMNVARALFSSNQDFISKIKGGDAQRLAWMKLASESVHQQMVELGKQNPALYLDYKNWIKNQFPTLMRTFANDLKGGVVEQGVTVKLDPNTGLVNVHIPSRAERGIPTGQFGPPANIEINHPAKIAERVFNMSVEPLARILEQEAGPLMQRVFQELGVDFNAPKQQGETLLDKFGKAIMGIIEGEISKAEEASRRNRKAKEGPKIEDRVPSTPQPMQIPSLPQPKVGMTFMGYKLVGDDPTKESSWEKVA